MVMMMMEGEGEICVSPIPGLCSCRTDKIIEREEIIYFYNMNNTENPQDLLCLDDNTILDLHLLDILNEALLFFV